MSGSKSSSADVRSRLDHPVIDSDGHMIEFEPDVIDYLTRIAGDRITGRYLDAVSASRWHRWHRLSPAERQERRAVRSPWWGIPTKNTLDRATATMPRLLHKRLDEFGIDFAVVYPSLGMSAMRPANADIRLAACRAFNTYYADLYRELSDRITPVAVIPMYTPEEAVAELNHVVNVLGLKAVTMPAYVRRPVPAVMRDTPKAAPWAYWLDSYGIDSEHDYDPVWAKCVELKVSPSFHSTAVWGSHASISNYAHNHIGAFATAGEMVCKSLFMGGATRRFPDLRFAFLEGGVGWACSLYAALVSHWNKRNAETVENYNPQALDRELLFELYERYGGTMATKLGRLGRGPLVAAAGLGVFEDPHEDAGQRDEWAACEIDKAEDIRDLFVDRFYFGSEADDPINAWAFDTRINPFGARLKTLFGSDIAHWDVPDMAAVIEEAFDLVQRGLLDETDFRDFTFANPVSLYGSNPNFFAGTAVEDEAASELSSGPASL